jgi:threonine aldolase
MKSFASDNYAGVLPEVMEALQRANIDHARSYGADDITMTVKERFKEVFEADVDVYFVFNGTGANVLSMSSATHSYSAVLCADSSHLYNDESSAPETFTGCRFFPVPTDEYGKLTTDAVARRLIRKGDVHYAQTALLSLTQTTEYGTLYTPQEITQLADLCKAHGLYLHMDGSRFFNAAASLGCSLSDISTRCGIDILSLGGTKAGMMYGEAVVVFNKALSEHIAYQQKQVMQLASKNRFIAAQFEAILANELWRTTASHANEMAQLLHKALASHPRIHFTKPVQANALFAQMPRDWYEQLQGHFPFYIWNEHTMEVRLMCAWDTTELEIDLIAQALAKLSGRD